MNANKTECYFNCPPNQFGANIDAKCTPCNSTTEFVTANPTECRKCAGVRFHRTAYYQCALCTSNHAYYSNLRSDCLTCPQRYMSGNEEKGVCNLCSAFVNNSGTTCYACDKPENVTTTEERCAQCKGQRYYDNGSCIICPDNISNLTTAQQEQCTT